MGKIQRYTPEETGPQVWKRPQYLTLLTLSITNSLLFWSRTLKTWQFATCLSVFEGSDTGKSLASESCWARVSMSQTRPCVECHEPDFGRLYIYIYPSLASESSSPRRTREPGSYVYGHLYSTYLNFYSIAGNFAVDYNRYIETARYCCARFICLHRFPFI
jgi:hypothetical protein